QAGLLFSRSRRVERGGLSEARGFAGVEGEVGRELEEPGREGARGIVAAEVLPEAQEDLLRDVLRQLGVAREAVGEGPDRALEAEDDLLEGGGVAARRGRDRLGRRIGL